MSIYTHRKITVWRIAAMALRGVVRLLSAWPLLLLVVFFISPVGPHLRWTYSYQDFGINTRVYYRCQYLGSRGFLYYMHGDTCPFITIIDRRSY